MKTLKTIVIVLVAIVAVFLIISYILPRQVHVERSAIIKSPARIVFEQVNTLKNWEKWSPWHKIDTTMKITYFGGDAGKDAGYARESSNPKAGTGRLTITESIPWDTIVAEMDFMKRGISKSIYLFNKTDSGTKVTWILESDLGKNPIARWMGLMMDKMVGKDFEQGLKNLNNLCLTIPVYKVELVNLPSFNYVGIRKKCGMMEMAQSMGPMMQEIMNAVQKAGLKITDAPFSVYYDVKPDAVDFLCAFSVDKTMKSKGDLISGTMKEGAYATTDYYGKYDNIKEAYDALSEWIAKNNKIISGPPFEKYLSDPMQEKDATKWLTKVYFPVK